MPAPTSFATSILAGDVFSASVACAGGEIIRIYMPADWTSAKLTMQLSPDGVAWRDAFDRNQELGFDLVPGVVVVIRPNSLRAINYMRFRSGSREKPIPQAAKRDFSVMILP